MTIAGGSPAKATLNIEPAVKKSAVTVAVSGAPGANVIIDGIDMGQAPFKGDLVAGRHTFEARATGFVTARQTTDVVYKEPLSIALDLSAERHEGHVRVEATPTTASIELDGKVVGSGMWEGPLAVGRSPAHREEAGVPAVHDGDHDQRRSIARRQGHPPRGEGGSSWIAWTIGTVLVVAGGGVAGYFLFADRPAARHRVRSIPAWCKRPAAFTLGIAERRLSARSRCALLNEGRTDRCS